MPRHWRYSVIAWNIFITAINYYLIIITHADITLSANLLISNWRCEEGRVTVYSSSRYLYTITKHPRNYARTIYALAWFGAIYIHLIVPFHISFQSFHLCYVQYNPMFKRLSRNESLFQRIPRESARIYHSGRGSFLKNNNTGSQLSI